MDQTQTKGRAERAEMRRSQVLEAAKHCFAQVGFHSTSMAEIANQAGMSVGQIYRYFTNKEALIEAIIVRDLEAQLDALDPGAQPDPRGLLAVMAAQPVEYVETALAGDRMALMLEIAAEAARNPRVRDKVEAIYARTRGALFELVGAVKPPEWSPAELEARLRLFSALLQGFAIQSSHSSEPATPEAYALLRRLARDLLDPARPGEV